jgi:hypothetical protein
MPRLPGSASLVLPFLLAACFAYSQTTAAAPKDSPANPSAGDKQQLVQTAAPIPANAPRISKQTRFEIIRDFEAQLVYARTTFPMGTKGLQLRDGVISPNGEQMRTALAIWGPAIKPGDPAHLSYVQIKDDHIHFEINGGPIHKKRWYQRVQVSGSGGTVQAPTDNPQANPHGSYVDLYFSKYVPEMTAQQLRDLLNPVLDFNARNKEQAYLDTVPPKVKEAIQAHHVLVGMNSEMVVHAKGKPPKKVRERDGETEYEEWIYGDPPADVDFVRIVADEVVQVKTMKVDGEKIVRTEKEVVLPQLDREAKKEPQERPANAPSLRRPGEDPDEVPKPADRASPMPQGPPPDTTDPIPNNPGKNPGDNPGTNPGNGPGEVISLAMIQCP